MAADTATPEQRIAELEDALKEKERRLAEVKADLDKANELVERMRARRGQLRPHQLLDRGFRYGAE